MTAHMYVSKHDRVRMMTNSQGYSRLRLDGPLANLGLWSPPKGSG